ncbi:MAG TPA: hypothetical protein VII75_04825 [Thermoanaerobaculia bacterium]
MLALFLLLAFAETPAGMPHYIATPGSQRGPMIAANDEGFFAVWEDSRSNGGGGIYGTRLTADGRPLDPRGIRIAHSSVGRLQALVWSGERWLVFTDRFDGIVHCIAIDRDGVVEAPQIAGDTHLSGVATNGRKTMLLSLAPVVYTLTLTVFDSRGSVMGRKELPVFRGDGDGARILSNGDGFFIWFPTRNGVNQGAIGMRLDANGDPLDAQMRVLATSAVVSPEVVSDGRDYLLYGSVLGDSGTALRRIGGNGTVGPLSSRPQRPGGLLWTGDHFACFRKSDSGTFEVSSWDRDGNEIRPARAFYTPSARSIYGFAAAANRSGMMLLWSEGIISDIDDEDVAAMAVDAHTNIAQSKQSISINAANQIPTGIAAGPNSFAVAWQEPTDDAIWTATGFHRRHDAYVERLDASGRPLAVVRLTTDASSGTSPRVAWNGHDYDVAWLEPGAIRTNVNSLTTCADDLDLAAGGNVSLLVWTDCSSHDLLAARIGIDSVPLTITRGGAKRPRVAWNGRTFAIAWHAQSDVRLARVAPTLALLDPFSIEVQQNYPTSDQQVEVASSGTESLVVYLDEASTVKSQLLARLVGNDGRLSDPIVVATASYLHDPAVAWNDGAYVVAWWQPGAPMQTARVTRRGDVSAPTPLFNALTPRLASAGASLLVLYERPVPEFDDITRAFFQLLVPRARAVPH